MVYIHSFFSLPMSMCAMNMHESDGVVNVSCTDRSAACSWKKEKRYINTPTYVSCMFHCNMCWLFNAGKLSSTSLFSLKVLRSQNLFRRKVIYFTVLIYDSHENRNVKHYRPGMSLQFYVIHYKATIKIRERERERFRERDFQQFWRNRIKT